MSDAVSRDLALPDCTLLREDDMFSVYIIYQGIRYGFPSIEHLVYTGKSLKDVRVVPPGALAHIPKCPPDGTYVQEGKTGHLYLVREGFLVRIEEDEFKQHGGSRESVIGVPWGTLGEIPYAGRYAPWKVGRLAPVVLCIEHLARKPVVRRTAGWVLTSVLGGVVAGVIVAALLGQL